jgi:hypothetical protein
VEVVALSPADVRRAAELFEVASDAIHVPHRTDATYHEDYLGQMVGAKAAMPAASSSSSSSSAAAGTTAAGTSAAKSKGKGRAAQ